MCPGTRVPMSARGEHPGGWTQVLRMRVSPEHCACTTDLVLLMMLLMLMVMVVVVVQMMKVCA